jgi:hypothetical protein
MFCHELHEFALIKGQFVKIRAIRGKPKFVKIRVIRGKPKFVATQKQC